MEGKGRRRGKEKNGYYLLLPGLFGKSRILFALTIGVYIMIGKGLYGKIKLGKRGKWGN